ncbi:DsbA family protein [Maritalea porphyrae]|uniref:Outer membrane protein n=1 Tax=Maritalea porphyrae TaxID=880732 RepID=A0ABQ5UVY2_9HYPH|nr:DsbA family protein [Maritalea porphyrae]GLQ18569.1 outer membrane protein [Maritalea porphyrae]
MQARSIYFITGALLLAAAILFAVISITNQQQQAQLSQSDIEQLIDKAIENKIAELAPSETAPALSTPVDTSDLGPAIESYLMANPSILQRMSVALQAETERTQNEQARVALASLQSQIYDDPDHVVLGNPNGDVTLVEFFDYNCGFCRQALADVMQLLDEDKNVRVILKEFPILSQGSVDAARIAVLVQREKDVSYLDFHTQLFASRGQIDKGAALKAAQSLGLNPVDLELQMGDQSVTDVISRSYQLAEALGISSTPNFIVGDELLRGAVGIDEMREKVKNMRKCGKATCNL